MGLCDIAHTNRQNALILRKLRNCHFSFFGVVYLCWPWKADKRPFCLFVACLWLANFRGLCKYKKAQRKSLKTPENKAYRRFFANHPPGDRPAPIATQTPYPAFCRKFFLWKIFLLSIFQLFMGFNYKVFSFYHDFEFSIFIFLFSWFSASYDWFLLFCMLYIKHSFCRYAYVILRKRP